VGCKTLTQPISESFRVSDVHVLCSPGGRTVNQRDGTDSVEALNGTQGTEWPNPAEKSSTGLILPRSSPPNDC